MRAREILGNYIREHGSRGVAEDAQISRNYLNKIARNAANPTGRVCAKIQAALKIRGVEVSYVGLIYDL